MKRSDCMSERSYLERILIIDKLIKKGHKKLAFKLIMKGAKRYEKCEDDKNM
jgi:hypothetical protein